MLKTVICDLFNIKYPIIQGGIAHVATAELVSAVSNAGVNPDAHQSADGII